jgi:3D (Asp-Asp-Asp) domain-containing protein
MIAGDTTVLPAPHSALPSRSNSASPIPTTAPVSGGQGDLRAPASQAHTHRATNLAHQVEQPLDILSAHVDSPPRGQDAKRDPLADLTKATTRAVWYAGPQGSAGDLSAVLRTVPNRTTSLSSLSLERVLDSQRFVHSAPVSITRGQGDLEGDLAAAAQRSPVAAGLKMMGVHPSATQYLQAAPGAPSADWTAATMPGGNARLFWITGYTWTGARTTTGTYPHWGTVAVDRRVIPLGSTVYIQGLGVFRAEDTGLGVVGTHVDVFVPSAAEAYQLTGYRLVSFIPAQ